MKGVKTMKLLIEFKKDYLALFSNINNIDKNSFYLLMTCHKSKKGGFGEPISENTCDLVLKKYNPEYYYRDI
jgi:hypothetical protein